MTIAIATAAGLISLGHPDPLRITPEAIAHGLARQNRWAGATALPVTTAQHSLLVHQCFLRIAPACVGEAIHALLHDAHEYLIGDITTPTVRALEARLPGTLATVAALKADIDAAIRRALGLPPPSPEALAAIDAADIAAAAIEWASAMPAANGPCPYGPPPRGLPQQIRIRPWPQAEDDFLTALRAELAATNPIGRY